MWYQGNNTTLEVINGSWLYPLSLFPTINDEIYIDNGYFYRRVEKWNIHQSNTIPLIYVCDECFDLFVSINNTLYCAMASFHQVIATSSDNSFNPFAILAGTGVAGSSSTTLSLPYGIFVDINYDLYVADCGNDRVQLFHPGQSNAVTIAGNGASNTINLDCPIGIILDADKYLFIVDHNNHRIVGSGPNGFRCLVGCSGGWGSTADRLVYPQSLSFDSYGNIYIADRANNRIQKFILATNSCGTSNHTSFKKLEEFSSIKRFDLIE